MKAAAPPILALAAALGLGAMALLRPDAAAAGWLLGFLACATPTIGAVALSLIAGLTGAGWGARTRAAAAAAPALALLWLPLAIGLPQIYPWAGAAAIGGPASDYLTPGFFAARSLVALGAWGGIGALLARIAARRVWIGLALLLHSGLVVIVAVDWVLSLTPGWMASDFPMNLAAQQIASGAAVAIIIRRGGEDSPLRDLTTLVVVSVLGVAYLAFMDYLIVWYGDLPARVSWYLARSDEGARALLIAAVALGVAAPVFVAAVPRLGPDLRARVAAVCALAGLALYQLFLLLPLVSGLSLLGGGLAVVLQTAALVWLARRRPVAPALQGAAHG